MVYDSLTYAVEFADAQGRTYAVLPIAADSLLRLHASPDSVAA